MRIDKMDQIIRLIKCDWKNNSRLYSMRLFIKYSFVKLTINQVKKQTQLSFQMYVIIVS